jgi:purine nucleosidase
MKSRKWLGLLLALLLAQAALGQAKRKIIFDQDCRGPATTDLQSLLVLLQSPGVEVLGITVVTGDEWRDEEVAHTLRLLEIIGRTDVPVVPGAVFPLLNSQQRMALWEKLYGRVEYQGAWNQAPLHGPFEVPTLTEGNPATKPSAEDAAHFIIRMVHKYPHEVSIYAGGPLTDLADAISIDPQVPELAQELAVMGGSVSPQVPLAWKAANRREFNFWFDPEAAHIVLTAQWKKVTVTTVDIAVKTRLSKAMIAEIGKTQTPVAQYLKMYANEEYMWDELAAATWLDPSIITRQEKLFMDVDFGHGPSYGDSLTWAEGDQPGLGERLVNLPQDLDTQKFYGLFLRLMTAAPPEKSPAAKTAGEGKYGTGN